MLLRRLDPKTTKNGRRTAKRTAAFGSAALGLCAAVLLVLPAIANAQVNLGLEYATGMGLGTTDIRTMVGNVIKGFMALLGIVAVVLILYAGFLWMTAGGNEEKVQSAKKILINATIGLVIIMAAYAITAFIFQAIQGSEGGAGEGGGGGSALTSMYCPDCGADQLGKIIEYTYPEAGQNGVARNTKVAITMKKPLMLSTVFLNYDDKGTYSTADDVVCDPDCATAGHAELKCANLSELDCNKVVTTKAKVQQHVCAYVDGKCSFSLQLNTANFKILPNESLGATQNTQDKDKDFGARYPDNANGLLLDPAPLAMVSDASAAFDPNNKGQTIVIKPVNPIGSSDKDMNYRVAMRGGPNGLQVWDDPSSPATACAKQNASEKSAKCTPAFASLKADGSYYWTFTTGTALDLTPPQLTKTYPFVQKPADLSNPYKVQPLYRNQMLQVYFDKALDPTTSTGKTGAGGFNWVNVEARCLPGTTAANCPFGQSNFTAIDGQWEIGNRYRTLEFTPSSACEGISENSCGDAVYCLPKNVELRITVKPSAVKTPPAVANFPPNGLTDMVGNSFDGNLNGKGEGPTPGTDAAHPLADVDLNQFFGAMPADVSTYSDTDVYLYHVGDTVDLVPPAVIDISPKNPPSNADFPNGPSKVPPGQSTDISITWSKVMSATSMVAGDTVYINSKEYQKTATCTAAHPSGCQSLVMPAPTVDVSEPLQGPDNKYYTVLNLKHRDFFTANQLGWSEADGANFIPSYLPVIRSRVKDTTQNCFYPSQGFSCDQVNSVNSSCYNGTAGQSFDWTP